MKNRLSRLLFAVPLAASLLLPSAAHGGSDSQTSRGCKAPGTFVAWLGEQVIVSDSGRLSACDGATGEMSASGYEAPKELSDAEKEAAWQSLKETFPKTVAQKDPVTGIDIEWKNIASLHPDAALLETLVSRANLLRPADGELAVYVAQGRTSGGKPSGPAGTRAGLHALLYRHAGEYRVLRLEFSEQESKEWPGWGYPWDQLAGRLDPQSGRTLLFFTGQKLGPDPYRPAWAPFNAWWFDPQSRSLAHIVIPNGPWFSDVAADAIVRPFSCFSCGCDCYRHYDVKVSGGSIFIQISAEYSALRDVTTGTYVLRPASSKWQKIPGTESSTTLDQIADDGCKIALNRSGRVEILPLCGSAIPGS
jgi:hypothetical protein